MRFWPLWPPLIHCKSHFSWPRNIFSCMALKPEQERCISPGKSNYSKNHKKNQQSKMTAKHRQSREKNPHTAPPTPSPGTTRRRPVDWAEALHCWAARCAQRSRRWGDCEGPGAVECGYEGSGMHLHPVLHVLEIHWMFGLGVGLHRREMRYTPDPWL